MNYKPFPGKSLNNMRPARSTKKTNPSASGGQKGTTAGASSQGRRDAGGAVVSKCCQFYRPFDSKMSARTRSFAVSSELLSAKKRAFFVTINQIFKCSEQQGLTFLHKCFLNRQELQGAVHQETTADDENVRLQGRAEGRQRQGKHPHVPVSIPPRLNFHANANYRRSA